MHKVLQEHDDFSSVLGLKYDILQEMSDIFWTKLDATSSHGVAKPANIYFNEWSVFLVFIFFVCSSLCIQVLFTHTCSVSLFAVYI